jgi:cell wall-associated NlpC family hydrolase
MLLTRANDSNKFRHMHLSKRFPIACFLGSVLVLAGAQSYAAEPGGTPDQTAASQITPSASLADLSAAIPTVSEPAAPTSVRDRAASLVENALGFIGVKYRRGGTAPETGFDCSGLVKYVFHDAWGLDLPRRAEQISHIGERIGKDQLKPGDLVFYSTLRKTVSHVGIYLGDGQFIHAPSRGEQVRVEDMNQPYWIKRFSGARRISQDDVEQASR